MTTSLQVSHSSSRRTRSTINKQALWLSGIIASPAASLPMNTTNAAVEQMAKYYWGSMLGAARTTTGGAGVAATSSSLIRSSWPPPSAAAHGHGRSGGEPSWEELAFARDAAAGQLGGCVWPPRSYTCTFCRREFRSAQALGGHMNVHRRDRARLRQCASPPDHDQEAPIAAGPLLPSPELQADHHQLLQLQQGSPPCLFRTAKAAVLISGRPRPAAWDHHQNYYSNNNREEDPEEAVISTTTSPRPRYISTTIIKESKSKVLISIPAPTAGSKEAAIAIVGEEEEEEEEEEINVAGRRKRRRLVHQPPEPAFHDDLRFPASSPKGKGGIIDEHAAKVPKLVTSSASPSSPSSLHLAGRQEVDLELRLGTS